MRRILKKVVALFTILLLLIGSTLPAMAVEESESQELYRLTVESEHGTLEIYDGTGKQLVEADSIIKVVEGEKLSIIARPDKGYQLKNLVINGEELEVNEEKAEYIMPDQDVIIHVEFSEEEKQKEEVTEEIELEENEKEKIFSQKIQIIPRFSGNRMEKSTGLCMVEVVSQTHLPRKY